MEKIRFYNSNNVYKGSTDFINGHVIAISFREVLPTPSEINNGFQILNENNDYAQADYKDFTTVYRVYEDDTCRIEFSDDGSVYAGPEKNPETEPYIPTLDEIKSQSFSFIPIGTPSASDSRAAFSAWSKCACVKTISLTV